MRDFARAEQFRFLDHRYDPHTGVATLTYGFDHGEPLTEEFVFPYAPWPEDPARQAAFSRALGLLHLIAGISYYKAALPAELVPGDHVLDDRLAAFLDVTWSEGLAEFAHRNGLDLEGYINFPVAESGDPESLRSHSLAEPLELPPRALVAMGGGKDSLVSLEMLREADVSVQPVTVGSSTLIGETVSAAGLPLLRIQRRLAPRLMEMNEAGAWNGHVPVTAINMAILTCAALLYGYRWVVFSNERSAEEETLRDAQGRPVNHQYSKSLRHERGFQSIVHERVAPDLGVFSLLRPLGEAEVTRRFSQLTTYHPVFSSCNRNFHHDGARIDGRWCGDCPKCRFTTLALAPWLSPEAVRDIIGSNLLDSGEQEEGFRGLCALGVDKPFECVGTVEESRALLASLLDQPAWADSALVRTLGVEAQRALGPNHELKALLESRGPHEIPDEIAERVDL